MRSGWLLVVAVTLTAIITDALAQAALVPEKRGNEPDASPIQRGLIDSLLPIRYDDVVTLLLKDANDSSLDYLYTQTAAIKELVNTTEEISQYLFVHHSATTLPISSDNASLVVHDYVSHHSISMLEGGLPEFVQGEQGLLFVDPINLTTGVHQVNPNFVYLFPTYGQQCFAFAEYLHSTPTAQGHVVIREEQGMNTVELVEAMNVSLNYFHIHLASPVLRCQRDIAGIIPTTGITFLVGLQADDVHNVVQFLLANEQATVMINFDDLTIFYDHFLEELGDGSNLTMVRSQIIFVTNLPRWSFPPETNDGMFSMFFQHTTTTFRTPAALRSYFVEFFVDYVTQFASSIERVSLQNQIFATRSIHLGPITFGPYGAQCAYPSNVPFQCLTNSGAANMNLWAFSSLFDVSEKPLLSGITPAEGGLYAGRSNEVVSELFTLELVMLYIVLGGQVALLAGLGIIMATGSCGVWTEPATVLDVYVHRSHLDNRHRGILVRPMKASLTFFSDKVSEHVKRYGAVELETTNSGFTVATRNATTAVRLAVELSDLFSQDDFRILHSVIDLRMGMHTMHCDCAEAFESGNLLELLEPVAVIARCISREVSTWNTVYLTGWTSRAARTEVTQRGWRTTHSRIYYLDDLTTPIPISRLDRPDHHNSSATSLDPSRLVKETSRSSTPQQHSSSASTYLWKPFTSSGAYPSSLVVPSAAVCQSAVLVATPPTSPPLPFQPVPIDSTESISSPTLSPCTPAPSNQNHWLAIPHPPADEDAEQGRSYTRGLSPIHNVSGTYDLLFANNDDQFIRRSSSPGSPRPILCLSSSEVGPQSL